MSLNVFDTGITKLAPLTYLLQVHQRLTTILDHWAARQIFAPSTVAFMKDAMVRGPEEASTAVHPTTQPPQVFLPLLQAITSIVAGHTF